MGDSQWTQVNWRVLLLKLSPGQICGYGHSILSTINRILFSLPEFLSQSYTVNAYHIKMLDSVKVYYSSSHEQYPGQIQRVFFTCSLESIAMSKSMWIVANFIEQSRKLGQKLLVQS